MSRLPWDPAEIGSHETDLDGIAGRLERHAQASNELPSLGLANRVQALIDREPLPPARWWQRRGGLAGWQAPLRLAAVSAVLVAGVIGGLTIARLTDGGLNSGGGPTPSVITTPSPRPSPTLTPSPSPSPTNSPTVSPSPSPTSRDRSESPEPSESDDDNSGSGGGGDNSGPGSSNGGPGSSNSSSGSGSSGSGSGTGGSGGDNSGSAGGD